MASTDTPKEGTSYASAAGGSAPSDNSSSGTTSSGGNDSSNPPNASFNNEVGTKNDPARVAINKMQEADVPQAGVQGGRSNEVSNDGQFDKLGETEA